MRHSLLALVGSVALAAVAPAQDANPLAAAKSKFAMLAGHKIHYKSLGDGKTALVLVHGWSCDMTFWEEQVPALAGKIRLVLIDLPGHGKSDKRKIDYTMDLFARGVEAVLADAGVERAVLAGHSMGTPVVRQYYRLHPKKTAALIAVDGALRNLVKDPADVDKIVTGLFEGDFKANVAKFVDRRVVQPCQGDVRGKFARLRRQAEADQRLFDLVAQSDELKSWVRQGVDELA